jgi:hypothetical protein
VAATAGTLVVPILVDCSKNGQNGDLQTKYKVEGYPTVVYTDSDGKQIKEMGSRDASAISKEIQGLAAKYPAKPSFWTFDRTASLTAAKKAKKNAALVLASSADEALKIHAKFTKDLADRKSRFVWIMELSTEEKLKAVEAEKAPVVVVFNGATGDVAAKIAIDLEAKADVVNKALDEAVKGMKK